MNVAVVAPAGAEAPPNAPMPLTRSAYPLSSLTGVDSLQVTVMLSVVALVEVITGVAGWTAGGVGGAPGIVTVTSGLLADARLFTTATMWNE